MTRTTTFTRDRRRRTRRRVTLAALLPAAALTVAGPVRAREKEVCDTMRKMILANAAFAGSMAARGEWEIFNQFMGYVHRDSEMNAILGC
jgi:hypothetical protein